MKHWASDWDFPYQPHRAPPPHDEPEAIDVVVATAEAVPPAQYREALARYGELRIEVLVQRAPLFWVRVGSPMHAARHELASALSEAGIAVRYVASAVRGTMGVPPALVWTGVPKVKAADWHARPARPVPATSLEGGNWFLGGAGGVRVDRRLCGTGAGTRLAVIDDDAADFDRLELERVVPVGVTTVPTASGHGALMVGWAAGATRPDGTRFVGVAPDTSVRVYCPPKPGADVVSLPLALARAVFDGADVVVCATYVEGTTSPMLDDALAVASRLGRGGRGTPVVMPTGRETSSPPNSVHASLSLALGDPASDPRVHCVAPGGREGGWFLWRATPRSKLRPFSNRGPSVRWLAPGDDVGHPFSSHDRLFHAESSGASAIAAGVLLLVLSRNPGLNLHEVHTLLARTVDAPHGSAGAESSMADPADLLPRAPDADGHDARVGYGRLNANRACLGASDPVALELVAMGEEKLATAWVTGTARPYSGRLARWAVRILLGRSDIEHAMRVVLRHVRLVSAEPSRAAAHAPGALSRHLCTVVRELGMAGRPSPLVREELQRMLVALERASWAPSLLDHAIGEGALAVFRSEREPIRRREAPIFAASPGLES